MVAAQAADNTEKVNLAFLKQSLKEQNKLEAKHKRERKKPSRDERYLARLVEKQGGPDENGGVAMYRQGGDGELDRLIRDEEKKYQADAALYKEKYADRDEKKDHQLDYNTERKLERLEDAAERYHDRKYSYSEHALDSQNEEARTAAEAQKATLEGERKAKAEQKKAEEEEQEKRKKLVGRVVGMVKDTGQQLSRTVGEQAYKISNWNTPGGIGILVVLLVILSCTVVIVNANGDTRLKQFWYMLAGRAQLQGKQTPVAGGITYTDQFNIEMGNVAGSALSWVASQVPAIVAPGSNLIAGAATPVIGGIGQDLQNIGNSLNQFRGFL